MNGYCLHCKDNAYNLAIAEDRLRHAESEKRIALTDLEQKVHELEERIRELTTERLTNEEA